MGYSTSNKTFIDYDGEQQFIIDYAYFFYKKEGKYVLLGSVNKNGLFDKNNICLEPVELSGYDALGMTPSLLADSLLPHLVIQSQSQPDRIRQTELFVVIGFDLENDNLKALTLDFFWSFEE
jgi:hypothetical protein